MRNTWKWLPPLISCNIKCAPVLYLLDNMTFYCFVAERKLFVKSYLANCSQRSTIWGKHPDTSQKTAKTNREHSLAILLSTLPLHKCHQSWFRPSTKIISALATLRYSHKWLPELILACKVPTSPTFSFHQRSKLWEDEGELNRDCNDPLSWILICLSSQIVHNACW